MTTALVIGDPHIKVTDLKVSGQMADEIVEVARNRSPSFIVCLGDTLDRHENIHTEPLVLATKWLYQLSQVAPVYLLIGNHDRINNSDFLTDKHPFIGLKWWSPESVTVVDTVTCVTIHNLAFFLVPYVPPGRLIEALESHPDWSPDNYRGISWAAGFTHQEIYGTPMGSVISTKGDKWPLDWPLLINGHIHDRHQPQENVINVGTPRQHAFGENPDKTISLFTFKSGGHYQEERISLSLPKKITYEISAQQWPTLELPEDHHQYRVVVTGNSAELSKIDHSAAAKKLRQRGVKMVTRNQDNWPRRDHQVISETNTNFKERLANRLQEEPTAKKVFNRLFPTARKIKIIRKSR